MKPAPSVCQSVRPSVRPSVTKVLILPIIRFFCVFFIKLAYSCVCVASYSGIYWNILEILLDGGIEKGFPPKCVEKQ